MTCCGRRFGKLVFVDPGQSFYYHWLVCVSLTVVYNSIMIIARSVFWKLNNSGPWFWFFGDCVCDAIYLMDMVIAARTG